MSSVLSAAASSTREPIESAPFGQAITQAEQKMQRPASMARMAPEIPNSMASVGHASAHSPEPSHSAGSISGMPRVANWSSGAASG